MDLQAQLWVPTAPNPIQLKLADPGNEIESDTDVDKNTASSDDEETADYVDESPEGDSGSSSDSDIHEDIMEGNVTESVRFMYVNQCTTTRSGRMIVAAKRFMYDTGLFSSSSNEDYTYCSTCRWLRLGPWIASEWYISISWSSIKWINCIIFP